MKQLKDFIKELLEHTKYADILVIFEDELLLLKRANYNKTFGGKWCLPGGHVINGEDSKTTIIRELYEETNIEIDNPELFITYQYQTSEISDIFFIILDTKPTIKISKEHSQYKWVKFDELYYYDEKFAGETFNIIKNFMENKFDNINEWLEDVKTKWHPKEDLFSDSDPNKIANYLIKNSKDKGQAMKRLVFYMNRAGDNIKNKTVLNKVKKLLKE